MTAWHHEGKGLDPWRRCVSLPASHGSREHLHVDFSSQGDLVGPATNRYFSCAWSKQEQLVLLTKICLALSERPPQGQMPAATAQSSPQPSGWIDGSTPPGAHVTLSTDISVGLERKQLASPWSLHWTRAKRFSSKTTHHPQTNGPDKSGQNYMT